MAAEMLRQAELGAWIARHPHQHVMPGTPPEKADPELWISNPRGPLSREDAQRARNHLRSILSLLRGRTPPAHLRQMQRLFEGLGVHIRFQRRTAGAPPKAHALFAKYMLEWVATGLRYGADIPPKAFESSDLLLLARCTGIEKQDGDDVKRRWRALAKKYR